MSSNLECFALSTAGSSQTRQQTEIRLAFNETKLLQIDHAIQSRTVVSPILARKSAYHVLGKRCGSGEPNTNRPKVGDRLQFVMATLPSRRWSGRIRSRSGFKILILPQNGVVIPLANSCTSSVVGAANHVVNSSATFHRRKVACGKWKMSCMLFSSGYTANPHHYALIKFPCPHLKFGSDRVIVLRHAH